MLLSSSFPWTSVSLSLDSLVRVGGVCHTHVSGNDFENAQKVGKNALFYLLGQKPDRPSIFKVKVNSQLLVIKKKKIKVLNSLVLTFLTDALIIQIVNSTGS